MPGCNDTDSGYAITRKCADFRLVSHGKRLCISFNRERQIDGAS